MIVFFKGLKELLDIATHNGSLRNSLLGIEKEEKEAQTDNGSLSGLSSDWRGGIIQMLVFWRSFITYYKNGRSKRLLFPAVLKLQY